MTEETTIINREHWLTELAQQFEPMIKARCGLSIPKYRVSCGFPSSGGAGSGRRRTVGQCWSSGSSADVKEIFIHPEKDEPVEVAEILIHEMLHAALPPGTGHKKPFARACVAVGLEGKPTSTNAGEELTEALTAITERLGDYPHDALDVSSLGKQVVRNLKMLCPMCGYRASTTRKWIDEAGTTVCPTCLISMDEIGYGESMEAETPLLSVNQSVEYKIPTGEKNKAGAKIYDDRYLLRMVRENGYLTWYVIDYGDHLLGLVMPRMVTAESRQEAVNAVESIREGLLKWSDLETDDDAEVDDTEDDDYIDDEDIETPDYEDGYVDPVAEEAIALEAAKREAWVHIA